MTAAGPSVPEIKGAIEHIASVYGIEVVGFLRLDKSIVIPPDEMELLKGVKWSEGIVDMSNVQNPAQVMPGARTMIILGKRLIDDTNDTSYRFSDGYTASVEAMLLDIASAKVIGELKKLGCKGEEYTSYYLKAWAVLAGLGWIGKSRMFVSRAHGPRLRIKGVLTDSDLGEPRVIMDDASCGKCRECAKACPVGAITETEVDRKKCGACPQNHRRISERVYSYCTACTASCPVGKKT
ncbi:MAG TPA: 4Fe-4S binding protein [Methanocellaceae archaeon]